MSSKKQFASFLAIICLAFSFPKSLVAQSAHKITSTHIPQVVDHLLIAYPDLIHIDANYISQFLEDAFYQTNPGQTIYHPPLARLSASQLDEISFQWEAIPMATGYTIKGLGLADGALLSTFTNDPTITIDQLVEQLYLFAFISEGPDALHHHLSIIIADKNLDYSSMENQTLCLCDRNAGYAIPPNSYKQTSPLVSVKRGFDWTSICTVDNYIFTLTGIVNGQNFEVEYSFLYEGGGAQFTPPKVRSFEDCNPSMISPPQSIKALVESDVIFHVSLQGITFELLNNSPINSFDVQGKWCGCVQPTSLPRSERTESVSQKVNQALFEMAPNPFTTELNIKIDVPNPQIVAIQLFDRQGRLVISKEQKVMTGSHPITLFASHLERGMYYVQCKSGDQVYRKKVLKF